MIGPVVDVEFPPAELPEIDTALTLDVDLGGETTTITCEVAQHIGDATVRAIALKPTDGVVRGAPSRTLAPRSPCRWARGCSVTCTTCSGSRSTPPPTRSRSRHLLADPPRAPPFAELEPKVMLETGIKVIDLLEPYVQGGKIGMFGGAGVGKTVIIQEMMPPGRTARRRLGLRRRGERTREGNDLFLEMTESGVIEKTALVFGQMDEPPGVRLRVALSALTMAEYFRDESIWTCCCSSTTSSGSRRRVRRSRPCSGACRARWYQPNLAGEMGDLQERITSAGGPSMSLQAMRAGRRHHRPGAARGVRHLDATTVLSRDIASLGIYPAVDPLDSTSRILDPRYVGEDHYAVAGGCGDPAALQGPAGHHRDPRHRRALRGGQGDRLAGTQIQRFLSQPFFVAEQFTGLPGKYTPVDETIASFKALTEGRVRPPARAGVLPRGRYRGGRGAGQADGGGVVGAQAAEGGAR